MPRPIRLAPIAALALAACGEEHAARDVQEARETGTYRVDPETGETIARIDTADGVATMRSGENVPARLPAGFTIFPGARVVNSTNIARRAGSMVGCGALIIMESEANPAEMAEFYRAQAQAAGLGIELELGAESGHMIAGTSPEGASFSFAASRKGDRTAAQLMVGVGLD